MQRTFAFRSGSDWTGQMLTLQEPMREGLETLLRLHAPVNCKLL